MYIVGTLHPTRHYVTTDWDSSPLPHPLRHFVHGRAMVWVHTAPSSGNDFRFHASDCDQNNIVRFCLAFFALLYAPRSCRLCSQSEHLLFNDDVQITNVLFIYLLLFLSLSSFICLSLAAAVRIWNSFQPGLAVQKYTFKGYTPNRKLLVGRDPIPIN